MKNRCRSFSVQAVQRLESRTLLSYSVSHNSAVVMNTSLGEVAIQLDTDGSEPNTISNFLSYVTAGTYNGTIFHRVTYNGDNNQDTFGIVQGGGFTNSSGTLTTIPTNAPIVNEYTDAHPNSIGTISIAHTSGLNSATSEFFFNTTDNSSVFGSSNPYAAFGTVIRGLGVVDNIDYLDTSNSVSASDGESLNPPETSTGGFVTINSATEEDTMTVTIGANDVSGDKSVTFQDPTTKSNVTISLANADATLTFTGNSMVATPHGNNVFISGNNIQLQQISSVDSTAKSALKINGNASNIGEIDITGSINSISGSTANLSGDINVTGGINTLKLQSTSAAGNINLDTNSIANAPATTISIPTLTNISIQSNADIKKLSASAFTVNDGTYRGVSANNIVAVSIPGNVQGVLRATNVISTIKAGDVSAYIAAGTIGSIALKSINNSYIFSSAAYNAKTLGITKVSIQGAINSAEVVAAGNIGSISAGSMSGSTIVAGIDATGNNAPADSFQYALASNATLQSLTMKAPKASTATSFSDSQIIAYKIDSLALGRIDTTTSGSLTVTGLQSNDIESLSTDTDKNQSLKLSNITDQTTVNAQIARANVDLGDFTIDVI